MTKERGACSYSAKSTTGDLRDARMSGCVGAVRGVPLQGGEGVLTENPSILQFKRGRGWWWCVGRRSPPPSRVSSEGGVEGVLTENPSISQFKRGRGWW